MRHVGSEVVITHQPSLSLAQEAKAGSAEGRGREEVETVSAQASWLTVVLTKVMDDECRERAKPLVIVGVVGRRRARGVIVMELVRREGLVLLKL